jgi:hypothetical protein
MLLKDCLSSLTLPPSDVGVRKLILPVFHFSNVVGVRPSVRA